MALRQDMQLLQKILETNHPSLYWYTPKDSVDLYFKNTISSLNDSLNELQFRNKVSWVTDKIRCGHTQVRFSRDYSNYYNGKRLPQFPLLVRVWGDSIVVVNNFHRDSILKRGTIITAINGMCNRQLLDSMYTLIGGDGITNSFQQQVVSFYFPSFYKSTFGIDSTFKINYIDSTGSPQTTNVKTFRPPSDSLEKRRLAALPHLDKKERKKYQLLALRNMVIDTALKTAVLNINTFSDAKLNRFFRKSFRTIRKMKLENVVVDLRENSGGNIFSSTRLTQYLADRPFKIADTVAAINRKFEYRKYIKPWFLYWLSMHLTGRKQSDGRIHFRYFEKHYFKPKVRNHFAGDAYVLTGGYTFSAAAMVTSELKGQKNVTIVGEETGGGSYGNTAVHLPVVTLPNSKLRIVVPLYRLVMDSSRPKNGRGIFPDVEVQPSSVAIKRGIDIKGEKVREMIISKSVNTGRNQNSKTITRGR